MNDGAGAYSMIWGNLYLGDNLWPHDRFVNAFVVSSLISFVVLVESIVRTIIVIEKSEIPAFRSVA